MKNQTCRNCRHEHKFWGKSKKILRLKCSVKGCPCSKFEAENQSPQNEESVMRNRPTFQSEDGKPVEARSVKVATSYSGSEDKPDENSSKKSVPSSGSHYIK